MLCVTPLVHILPIGSQQPSTPDGELTVHDERVDSNLDACPTVRHPPYGSREVDKDNNERPFRVIVGLAELAFGAESCGFCTILYQGVNSHRESWIVEWASCRWLESHPECNFDEVFQQEPWLDAYNDEINSGKAIDENDLSLILDFSTESHTVDVQLTMAEHVTPRANTILTLAMLEFYSTIGTLRCIYKTCRSAHLLSLSLCTPTCSRSCLTPCSAP